MNDLNKLYSKIFAGASWMALFKILSQVFSWAMTIVVARLLSPGDYGLMAMATIITGYAEIFSQLGFGPSIVQRQNASREELSSVFWLETAVSLLLALACFPIASLTASIMHEPRVIPLTQTVSLLFLLSGAQIVPLSLMKRDLDFRSSASIEFISTLVSSSGIVVMAYSGLGVWSLILGRILLTTIRLLMAFRRTKWLPSWHFRFAEALPFLRFGLSVTIGGTLFYIFEKSDRFFAGRRWSPAMLGVYTFGLELAQLPTEKITALINQVAFPALSKLQHSPTDFLRMYLRVTKITALLVLPLFVGGALVGDQLIAVLLNDKWRPAIPVFQLLCISQIFTSLNALNNYAHGAQNRPHWGMWFNFACAVLMPLSFYFASTGGLLTMVIPWFTTYAALCTIWIIVSNVKFGTSLRQYVQSIGLPLFAVGTMAVGIALLRRFVDNIISIMVIKLAIECLAGAAFYCGMLLVIDRRDSVKLINFCIGQLRGRGKSRAQTRSAKAADLVDVK